MGNAQMVGVPRNTFKVQHGILENYATKRDYWGDNLKSVSIAKENHFSVETVRDKPMPIANFKKSGSLSEQKFK